MANYAHNLFKKSLLFIVTLVCVFILIFAPFSAVYTVQYLVGFFYSARIKKKIKFSSYIRKFRVEQLQSHIWLTDSWYMGKYLRISSYIRKPFLIYDFATDPLWISLYMRKIWFSFLSVCKIATSHAAKHSLPPSLIYTCLMGHEIALCMS